MIQVAILKLAMCLFRMEIQPRIPNETRSDMQHNEYHINIANTQVCIDMMENKVCAWNQEKTKDTSCTLRACAEKCLAAGLACSFYSWATYGGTASDSTNNCRYFIWHVTYEYTTTTSLMFKQAGSNVI